MHYKIAFITSHYLARPTKEALDRLHLDCDYTVIPYDDFTHITQVYERYAEAYDGFLISGQSAMEIIQLKTDKEVKPMSAFQVDAAALYKALLQICIDNRNQDLHRVIMDVLLPLGEQYTVADFLRLSESDRLSDQISEWVRQIGCDGVKKIEQDLIEQIDLLWQKQSFDLVICQYSSIIPILKERGIPYIYPVISDHSLKDIVRELLVKIQLEHLRMTLPSVVYIAPKSGSVTPAQQRALSDWASEFFSNNLAANSIEKGAGFLCVELTVQNVRYFTNRGTTCMICAYLNSHLNFEVVTGYGIGSSIGQAMNNAQAAVKEAVFRGQSYIKDEVGNLVGPLGTEMNMVIPTTTLQDVGEIARRCSLSPMTIQKLMTRIRMTGSNKTTSHELSKCFNVTIRNANRILSSLEKGGYASIIYSQGDGTKGRPVKVYELNFQ